MHSLLIYLSLTGNALPGFPYATSHLQSPFPIAALIFSIIFGILAVFNIYWLIRTIRSRPNLDFDLEKQSLINAKLPESVVASNITVSISSRPNLINEITSDEQLVWAHETISPIRQALRGTSVAAFVGNMTGLGSAGAFLFLMDAKDDVHLIPLWIMLVVFVVFLDVLSVFMFGRATTLIYAVTSKRVFIYSRADRVACCISETETVRTYELEGIKQTTLTKESDGSGTLRFTANSVNQSAYLGLFAFVGIPNVSAVRDLVEQYKSLRIKAGSHM